MRVLQVDSGREWRGGQNQVRLLCRELGREPNVELLLVTRRCGELARRARADGVPVFEVTWTASYDPRAVAGILRALARFQPHLVHAHESHALRLALGCLRVAEAWRRFGRRSVGNHPTLVVGTRRGEFQVHRRRGIGRRMLGDSPWARAHRVIAISQAVKSVLVRHGIPPHQIAVVPSGIDPDEVRQAARHPLDIRGRLGLPPDTPLAVNVAALERPKDQGTLLRAAAAARALRPDLHWAVAGEGRLRGSLEAEIARLGVRDRVHLLGYVAEAHSLIREGNVFVMSSQEEGLGSVILDALALEKPVVATAGGGIPEILPPEALVPVGDYRQLARKVVEAVTRPPSPIPLAPQFTARAMAQGVLAVYRSLV